VGNILDSDDHKIVFFHRELPPLDAELMAEHTIEATSNRVAGTLSHRSELWDRCYQELMANAQARLAQEITRLGGHYAHVHDEFIDTRRRRGLAARPFFVHCTGGPRRHSKP
jgi:hypothetical protein